jgi:hypothetical protein
MGIDSLPNGHNTMAVMFEVYYRSPADERREAELTCAVEKLGGRLDFREAADRPDGSVILTYEFAEQSRAEAAASALRARGEHVEGPQDYGA